MQYLYIHVVVGWDKDTFVLHAPFEFNDDWLTSQPIEKGLWI